MASLTRRVPALSRMFYNYNRNKSCLVFCRSYSITGNPTADKALNTVTGGKIDGWLQKYENFVGLTEVKQAQAHVMEAERLFTEAQHQRQQKQQEMDQVQAKLRSITAELDRVKRGDERYLALLTEEHEYIRIEDELKGLMKTLVEYERQHFSALSSAVREAHEKERARAERTKYWSLIGSAIGAIIGILGTTLNNYLRMRELRGIVKDSAAGGVELKSLMAKLSDTMKHQHNQIQGFIRDLRMLVLPAANSEDSSKVTPIKEQVNPALPSEEIKMQTEEILNAIKQQDEAVDREMREIKKLLAVSKASDDEQTIVYVGPEVESMLQNTEQNLEWKMKINALWTVAFIYGSLAVTIPFLAKLFGGGS